MSSVRGFFVLIPVLVVILTVPVLIGIYVWRDAQRRQMNSVLWTLIAVIAPSLIGFIIYLLVRRSYSDLECPKCGAPVENQYAVCPNCGAKLRPFCPNCSAPVEIGWKVCPHCATPLLEEPSDIAPPIRRKDKSLGKILIAILIVPVLLIALAFLSFTWMGHGGSSSMREVSFDEYDMEQKSEIIRESVHEWLGGLEPRYDRAYALRYDYARGSNQEHFFLIYIPAGIGGMTHNSFGSRTGLFGTTLVLETEQTGNNGSLLCVSSTADTPPKLQIKLDGKKLPCEVTVVDYNPTLFFIVPQYDQLEPSSTDAFLPERVRVVKLVGNLNVGVAEFSTETSPFGGEFTIGSATGWESTGVVEITAEDMVMKLLAAIDGAPYLDLEHPIYGRKPDGSGGYDFHDGFEIIIEYKANDEFVLHPDMIRCLVFEQDGEYYLIDSYRPDNGRIFRQVDDAFYQMLMAMFE